MHESHKKILLILPLFALWLVGDLWTKSWADKTLADPYHPIHLRVGADQDGRPLADVIAETLGADKEVVRQKTMKSVIALPPALDITASSPIYSATTSPQPPYYYVFWRNDPDLAPRRIDRNDDRKIAGWLAASMPDISPSEAQKAATDYLSSTTFGTWLPDKIRRVHAGDVSSLTPGRVHPGVTALQALRADTQVKTGERYLIQRHHVDVMGNWWKYVYAENPGAAFGFLKGIPAPVRETIFGIMTIVIFFFIARLLWTTSARFWLIHVAMGSILAGAVGNFVDRIRYGYVIDFIDMDLGFMHWPTYNIADIAITVGVIFLILEILFNKDSPLVQSD